MKKLEAQGIHNGELHTELKSHIPYNLSEKRREIQQILTSINYENRNLLILRIYKGSWFLYYDQIYIFSKNKYNSKTINRLKINLRIFKTKLNRWRIKTRIYLHKRLFHKWVMINLTEKRFRYAQRPQGILFTVQSVIPLMS